jgi:hypothetical protein
MRAASLILVCLLASRLPAADAVPPANWEVRSIRGFTVLVHEEVLRQPADRWHRKPLDVLDTEFDDLKRVVGPKLAELLRQIPVWVRWDVVDPGVPKATAFYYGYPANTLARAGREPLMTNSIEIVSLKRIGEMRPPGSKFQQVVTLHEMAHAVHHRLLGFDAPEVTTTFQTAVERKLYDSATDRTGRVSRPYARTNANEYFAEISCAYLDSCFFYPFTYSDLKQHDAAGFALMESVWKRPEQFVGRGGKVETPRFAATQASAGTISRAGGLSTADAEREAFRQLDRAKALIREGKKAEAQQVLESLLKSYSSTIAAADARKTLNQLD